MENKKTAASLRHRIQSIDTVIPPRIPDKAVCVGDNHRWVPPHSNMLNPNSRLIQSPLLTYFLSMQINANLPAWSEIQLIPKNINGKSFFELSGMNLYIICTEMHLIFLLCDSESLLLSLHNMTGLSSSDVQKIFPDVKPRDPDSKRLLPFARVWPPKGCDLPQSFG